MAAPKARRFDFYPDDWLAGTRGLDASERGIYITACALIYSHGGPIDPTDLRASCPGDLRVYRRCLERLIKLGKLDLKRGYLSNKRCLSEVQLASKRVVKAVKNAHKRWGETNKSNVLGDATAYADQQSLPSPSPSPSPSEKKASKLISGELPSEWAERAAADRAQAGLPEVDLSAEWTTFRAKIDGDPTVERWLGWALKARVSATNGAAGKHTNGARGLPETPWPQRCRGWAKGHRWNPTHGPAPDEPGCWAPPDLIAEALRTRADRHQPEAAE